MEIRTQRIGETDLPDIEDVAFRWANHVADMVLGYGHVPKEKKFEYAIEWMESTHLEHFEEEFRRVLSERFIHNGE